MTIKRRTLFAGGIAMLLDTAAARLRAAHAPPGAADAPSGTALAAASAALAKVESSVGGRIGVAAVDTGNGARLMHRGSERFAMCSTFKWLLAAAVLDQVDGAGVGAGLDQPLAFSAGDVLDYAPVVKLHLAEGRLPIRELCRAAVEVSDNMAANALLKYIGGPAALTAYARRLGDTTTRLDRFETSLNTNLPGDPRDTTTPEAMIATMRTVLVGDALSSRSRDTLLGWMKNCQTGLQRLRAGLPRTWIVGDKTGTGDNGAANDLAIVWPPRRAPLLVAAYCDNARATPDALNGAHARIAQVVATAFA